MDWAELVLPPSQVARALWLLAAALATLAAAWTFEAFGYAPCELCYAERYAFYVGAPIAALTVYLAARRAHGVARALFVLLALIFVANAALAFYHVGVEQHWWTGPTACAGSLSRPVDVNDLMKSLNAARVISCDEVQLRILGLSLAGWDVVASAAMAIYAGLAARLAR
jgi:disulfide bond formation protein DsbB